MSINWLQIWIEQTLSWLNLMRWTRWMRWIASNNNSIIEEQNKKCYVNLCVILKTRYKTKEISALLLSKPSVLLPFLTTYFFLHSNFCTRSNEHLSNKGLFSSVKSLYPIPSYSFCNNGVLINWMFFIPFSCSCSIIYSVIFVSRWSPLVVIINVTVMFICKKYFLKTICFFFVCFPLLTLRIRYR